MWRYLLDVLFPPVSLTGASGVWITPAERSGFTLHPTVLHAHELRAAGVDGIDRMVAATRYAEVPFLREAIRRWKYEGVRAYDADIAQVMVRAIALLGDVRDPVLCPVPLHWARRCGRGFNQCDVLAGAVSERTGWPVRSLLRRVRFTGAQAKRLHAERRSAMLGAFAWSGGKDVPSSVVLVDDVATTGATLAACASVLRQAGVGHVSALVVAHG